MKNTVLVCLASLFSLAAFASEGQATTTASSTVAAPWSRIECRVQDSWGRVFTATGHDDFNAARRVAELQNQALDQCSQFSGLQNCVPMGCLYYN